MTRFLDGPAAGKFLPLRRAPVFLRVVTDGKKWDALDQLDDVPEDNERIFVYLISGPIGRSIVCARGGRGGIYMAASYRFFEQQPGDDILRDNEKWREWTEQFRGINTDTTNEPNKLRGPTPES